MTNRTSGKDRLIQIQLADEQMTVDVGHYTADFFKHELAGRLASGKLFQAGVTTPIFEGVVQDDADFSAGDDLKIQRKGAFKATVQATDAAAIAAQGFRIKGSGASDGLVIGDRGKAVYAVDSLTLTVQPTPGLPKAGYISKLVSYGSSGAGEAVVILDADWARAGVDDSDLDTEVENPISSVDFGGIDIGSRMTLVERFEQRPAIENIDITATDPTQVQMDTIMAANRNFAVAGTNMTSAQVTFAADKGGIVMTTAGADNDQAILQPRTDPANQSRWAAKFDSRQGLRWATSIRLPAITAISVKLGLALTNAHDLTTDADQTGLYFDTDTADTNWRVIRSIAGTDTESDSGVAVAAATEYRVVIDIDRDGVARTFINDVLVDTSAALTDVATLLPYVSIQARAAAAKVIDVRFQAISMDHAA